MAEKWSKLDCGYSRINTRQKYVLHSLYKLDYLESVGNNCIMCMFFNAADLFTKVLLRMMAIY